MNTTNPKTKSGEVIDKLGRPRRPITWTYGIDGDELTVAEPPGKCLESQYGKNTTYLEWCHRERERMAAVGIHVEVVRHRGNILLVANGDE